MMTGVNAQIFEDSTTHSEPFAFDQIEIIPEVSGGESVTCVAYFERYVYVGTKSGKVVQYEESKDSDSKISTFKVLQSEGLRSKRPIRLIEVVSGLGILVVLCGDGRIVTHSLQTLRKTNHLDKHKSKLKSVDTLCCSQLKVDNRLCCAVKLQLYL
eukprot:816867_1